MRKKLQKAYTIDVQGWQRKSNSKVTSLENFSAQLDSDSVIKTEVELDDDGDEIVEARDIASGTSFIKPTEEEVFN